MDFSLNPEARALGEAARRFAEETVTPGLAAREAAEGNETEDLRALWRAIGAHGLLGLVIPADFGGQGHGIPTAVHVLQEFGHGCRDNGLALALNAQLWPVQMIVLDFGTQTQKDTHLRAMVEGRCIVAHGVTEAAAGSDAMALQMRAEKTSTGWRLTGQKVHIGMAAICDMAVVFARTNPDAGAWGVSAFLVDCALPGVTRGAPQPKMGLRSVPTGTLSFDGCEVPDEALLGRAGAGASIFARSLEYERRLIFSAHVGAMWRQLDECMSFAREREVFGTPILQHQSVGNRLADMRLRYETSRLMLGKAAWDLQERRYDTGFAALVKLHISEAILANSLDAVRHFGGRGYFEADGIARDLRDAVGGVVYGGTSDIQRLIASRSWTGPLD